MLDDPGALILGLIFSSIGFGYFIYGKKQRRVVPLVTGLVLMLFPYVISNMVLIVLLGLILCAIPYFVRL
ncbi:MAG: amino acid transport protein [Nitrospirae bacterium]|nr:amino acid transport protein [Candidatus Manganitrophaceae bacterium]